MSLEVTQHHKLQYAASVQMVAQQTMNPLQNAVNAVPANGEAQSVADLLDQVEYVRGDENNRRNVENPVKGSRRWVVLPPPIKSGQIITKEEKFRSATDPTSNYVRAHTMAVNRGIGDITLGIARRADGTFEASEGGVLGIAREGKTPGTGTPLPASQFLAHSGTGMTLEKQIAAVEMLNLADFGLEDNMDELFCAITPKQKSDLLRIAALSGTALNAFEIKQIQDGKPTSLMGLTWIFTNRLPLKVGSSDIRLCPIWSKANIVRADWQGVQGRMWNDSSQDNLPYAVVDAYSDCVRAEDKGVVVLECKEV